MMMMTTRTLTKITTALGVLTLVACGDLLDVPDPQRYTSSDLDTALPAVANGVEGAVHNVMDQYVVYQALLADEYQHTGTWTNYDEVDHGRFQYGTSAMDGNSNAWHRAQWYSMDAERRFGEVMGESEAASSPLTAQVRLAGAFAALYLGMAFCESVSDPSGDSMTDMQMLGVAVTRFGQAMETARVAGRPDWVTAAQAGRAQAHLLMGDMSSAATDASAVQAGFSYDAVFNQAANNWVVLVTTKTFNEAAGLMAKWWPMIEEDDAPGFMRDPWTNEFDKRIPVYFDGEVATDNETPHYSQWKYNTLTSDIPMVHSDGMRLIEAEVMVEAGDYAGATAVLNRLRAAVDLAPFDVPTDRETMMEYLLSERFAELFMEGHRAVDLRRFGLTRQIFAAMNDESRSGDGRPTQFPISDDEALHNTNIDNDLTQRCLPKT